MYSLYLLPGYLRAGEYYNMVAILYGRKKSKLTVVHTTYYNTRPYPPRGYA